ncbi:MAG: 1-acyl-sn-glycerol-3-phosphate acyltransferase [Akkermansiaceae bacterium]|nr:1-acyl-sn-glycerol-3-phosphate acyltransferase [Akkermansiaceae bacterium]
MSEPKAKPPLHIRVQRVVLRAVGLIIVRLVYRVRVVGAENVPAEGGALLLPNHVTFADAFFISASCPRPVRFVMDDAVLKYAPVRWFCSVFNTVNIRRGQSREALRMTVEAVNGGDIVCYFAEGQLSRTGALNELKRGVELIAGKLDAPLVPLWVDGAWGSVFSFERNVFFRKKPNRLPHDAYSAFGPPLAPAGANTGTIRDALLRASAAALRLRFADGATPVEINGHQIGQVNALPWRKPFMALRSDSLAESLPALFDGFSQEFGARADFEDTIVDSHGPWVGGEALRRRLEIAPAGHEMDFYDFSSRASVPLEKDPVRHFPCLAIAGRVISMSMPDPATPRTGTAQAGSKPGTWGRLLPGWFIEGRMVKGPAAPEGLPLPEGAHVDEEGFVVAGGSP